MHTHAHIYVCVYIYIYISSCHNCHIFLAIIVHLFINSHIYILEVIYIYSKFNIKLNIFKCGPSWSKFYGLLKRNFSKFQTHKNIHKENRNKCMYV